MAVTLASSPSPSAVEISRQPQCPHLTSCNLFGYLRYDKFVTKCNDQQRKNNNQGTDLSISRPAVDEAAQEVVLPGLMAVEKVVLLGISAVEKVALSRPADGKVAISG